MKKLIVPAICLLLSHSLAGQSPDRKAVYDASMDYIEALYQSEPHRIERSVDTGVVRRGFYWKGIDSVYSDLRVMSYEQIVQLAKDWNKSRWLPETAVKKVEVFDVMDKTACAKITAYWGTEYLQLAKFGNQWRIMNILWQSIPKTALNGNNN